MRSITSHPFWRYCVVGGFGFVADWSVLQVCVRFIGTGPIVGRVVSVLAALTATWLLHRWFTFSVTGKVNFLEWIRYLLANALGALVNFLIYTGMLYLWPETGLTIPWWPWPSIIWGRLFSSSGATARSERKMKTGRSLCGEAPRFGGV